MKHKILIFAVLALLSSIAPIGVYAEEEDEEEKEDDRFGFGIQEREREHEREEGSSQFSGTILYVTIGAIVAAIGYTVFKIMRSKKATAKLR